MELGKGPYGRAGKEIQILVQIKMGKRNLERQGRSRKKLQTLVRSQNIFKSKLFQTLVSHKILVGKNFHTLVSHKIQTKVITDIGWVTNIGKVTKFKSTLFFRGAKETYAQYVPWDYKRGINMS